MQLKQQNNCHQLVTSRKQKVRRITEDYWYTDSWENESYIYDEEIIMDLRDAESMEVREWLYNNTEVSLGFSNFWYPGYEEHSIKQ